MNEEQYVKKVKAVSLKGLDVLAEALDGAELPAAQLRAATVAAPMEIKRQAVTNGHNRNMISLIKIGVPSKENREALAVQVLGKAGISIDASGGDVDKTREALAADGSASSEGVGAS